MNKRKKILLLYALVIFIVLIAIMFLIPDSFFLKLYTKNIEKVGLSTTSEETTEVEFVDYDTQIERLLNNKYKYEYLVLDSLSDKSYTYKCSGSLNDTVESGSCTEPSTFSYTEKDKEELFKINIKYLDAKYLFELVKDSTPEENTYQKAREYTYNVKLNKMDTEVIVYTDLDNITKIEFSNKYMTYIINYSDISY